MPTDVFSLMKMERLLKAAILQHCLLKNSFKRKVKVSLSLIREQCGQWKTLSLRRMDTASEPMWALVHQICMQKTRALFAGEASGHYYFKDNFYADNGMIPFLLVLEYLDANGTSLAESVDCLRSAYPVSGEINFSFETHLHRQEAVDMIKAAVNCFGNRACIETPIDGLSVRFNWRSHSLTSHDSGGGCWRFNLRESTLNRCCDLMLNLSGTRIFLLNRP